VHKIIELLKIIYTLLGLQNKINHASSARMRVLLLTMEWLHRSNVCLESAVCTRIIAVLLQPKWEEVSQQASARSLPGRCTWSCHIRFPFRQNQFTAPTKKQEAEGNSVWLQVGWILKSAWHNLCSVSTGTLWGIQKLF
jgi:hypothetical protein